MKERTEIDQQNLFFTYMELASCKCYDDARILLNDLVVEELGREYGDKYHFDEETDEWICDEVKYKNSANAKVVKLAVIDEMTSFLNRQELLSEEGTIAFEKSKVKDTAIIPFNRMDNDMRKVRDWLGRWKKEAAPIIKKEKTPRLRPTEAGKKYAPLMYKHLQEIAYIDANEQSWNYLCGLTDETNDFKPIRWLKTNFLLKVLIDNFLTKRTYFSVEAGAIKDTLYNSLADPEGNKINQKSVEVAITNRQGEERRKSGEKRNPKTDKDIKNAWMNMRVNEML